MTEHHAWARIALGIVLGASIFVMSPSWAADRACKGGERAELTGKILFIRKLTDRSTTWTTFSADDPVTGTCRLRYIKYEADAPPKCVSGARFKAVGRASRELEDYLDAEALTCD